MVNKVFANTAVKKVGNTLASVCAHPYQVGIYTVGKMQDTFFYIHIAVNMGTKTVNNTKTRCEIVN